MLILSLFPLNKSSLESAQPLHSFAVEAALFTELGRWENKTFIHKVRTFLLLVSSAINPKHCQSATFPTYRVYLMKFSHQKYGPVIPNAGTTL